MGSSSMSSLNGMSSMEGMGMDMGSDGMFRPVNQMLARTYWYLITAFFALALLLKGFGAIESWSRSVFHSTGSPYSWPNAAATGLDADSENLKSTLISCAFPFTPYQTSELCNPSICHDTRNI